MGRQPQNLGVGLLRHSSASFCEEVPTPKKGSRARGMVAHRMLVSSTGNVVGEAFALSDPNLRRNGVIRECALAKIRSGGVACQHVEKRYSVPDCGSQSLCFRSWKGLCPSERGTSRWRNH